MHKLWPHSVVKSQNSTKTASTQKNPDTTLNNSDKSAEANANGTQQTEKENNASDAIKSEIREASSAPQPESPKDSKTPMCLINELVKYNKVRTRWISDSLNTISLQL